MNNVIDMAILIFFIAILNIFVLNKLDHLEVDVKPHTHMKVESVPLPEKCAPFYNDGTDRWVQCMLVEPK